MALVFTGRPVSVSSSLYLLIDCGPLGKGVDSAADTVEC